MASQGSVPAANAALKLVDQRRQAHAGTLHREKIEDLRTKPLDLCRYLGELGQDDIVATKILGRALTEKEEAARVAGAQARKIEIRAIELGRARNGGSISPWMRN